MRVYNGKNPFVPTLQADAVLSQANPVSATLYQVLAASKNVRLIGMTVYVTWTVQPSPLEVVMTIDGLTRTWLRANPVSLTPYYPLLVPDYSSAAEFMDTAGGTAASKSFLLEARNLRIQVRTTGGTVQNIDAIVKYAKW